MLVDIICRLLLSSGLWGHLIETSAPGDKCNNADNNVSAFKVRKIMMCYRIRKKKTVEHNNKSLISLVNEKIMAIDL